MPFQKLRPDLFLWSDTCNVYVVKEGDAALLIDLGDGSVLDHLAEIGVRQVEWVLFTHHHREQCQGAEKLQGTKTKIGVPEAEREFFEKPAAFRKMKPTLGDAHSVYGASYVRPPVEPIAVEEAFAKMDDFTWRGREFWCVDSRGHSPGGMSYLLKVNEGWLAFTGDAMLSGAKLHNWFDSDWDYGFGKGLYALYNSAALLGDFDPHLMLPSHGPIIRNPQAQLREFQQKLRELEKHFIRGYELFRFSGGAQDTVSKPTSVPFIWQVSPHLYKFKGPDYWPNFHLLLADSGHALVVDCGLFNKEFLDTALTRMQERLGLKQIDAVIVTHMHGDHCQEAPHLREKWGAKIWTMERVVPMTSDPLRFDYVATINTYQKGFDAVQFDRILRDGETFEWEGYSLTADWMPGQTEFALCLHGRIDDKIVAFTGDNIFASSTDPAQTGHEAVVARNSCILEEGYLYAAEYLHGLQPDLLLGGHCWAIPEPKELIERYKQGALALRSAFRALSTDPDYRYMFDPFWVRAEPFRLVLQPGEQAEVTLHIRNFRDRPQQHKIEIVAPPGLRATPSKIDGQVGFDSKLPVKFTLAADAKAPQGIHLVAFDVTLDGHRYGQWFDMMVQVGDAAEPAASAPAKSDKSGY